MNKNITNSELKLSREERDRLHQELGNLLKDNFCFQQALQQQQEQVKAFNEELYLELIEIFDALEFLINYLENNPDLSPQFIKRLPKSISTVQKKLLTVLERRQVNIIDFQENKPDFRLCQVVDCEERNDVEEQTITKVVRRGFRVGDKLLRPIEVITAKPKHSEDG